MKKELLGNDEAVAWRSLRPGGSVNLHQKDPRPDYGVNEFVEVVPLYLHAKPVEQEDVMDRLKADKDKAYEERNRLVALLASLYSSGITETEIEGWDPEWNGCVYIDFPWGQASWHFHDSQAYLFSHLPPYQGEWDGHTTDEKYAAIHAAPQREPGEE